MCKAKLYFILALCLFSFSILLAQTNWYVDGTVGSTGNGSQGSPFKTIAEAVTALSDGDIVNVAAATYEETVDFDNHYFILTGTSGAASTLIDGNSIKEGIIIPDDDPDITGESTITGFTIRDCEAGYDNNGGGIYIENRNVTISNCIITGNSVSNDGGGIYFRGNDEFELTIQNCTITDNDCDGNGGGVCFYGNVSESLTMENCIISDNECVYLGAGIYASGISGNLLTLSLTDLTIHNNDSTNNSEFSMGGGIYAAYLDYSTLTFEHLLVYENTSYDHGSGICISNSNGTQNDPLTLNKLTIVDNECDVDNPGIYFDACSNTLVTNSIIWNDATNNQVSQNNVTYCCIYNDHAGTGNFDDDPEFVDASGDDYSLEYYSPCIDKGDPGSDDDDDGSLPDRGWKYHEQDVYIWDHEITYIWRSYPRLPFSQPVALNTGQSIGVEEALECWNPNPDGLFVWFEDEDDEFEIGEYDNGNWSWTYERDIYSVYGYKMEKDNGTGCLMFSRGLLC
ncbi:MAG: right-handed parallel beta-helix repeat-containing protein [Candidatus Cloacimonetes bacterium]|nr:right-handed parallel beta-helix repeat-containing protein [Candidatus Cloacimonadota bacterium]